MICNECSKRKCRTEAVYNTRSGRFTCSQFQKPRGGWSMLELVLDSSTEAVVSLLHRNNLRIIETKKGLKVRYAKNKQSA